MNKDILAIKEKNGNTFTHELFKVGELSHSNGIIR